MHGRARNKLLAKASNFFKRPECFMRIVSLVIFSLVTSLYTLLPYIKIQLRWSLGRTVTSEPMISHILQR